jgi:hypothetical protein
MSAPKGVSVDVRRVIGDSPFRSGRFTYSSHLNGEEVKKTLAAIETLGFEQLMAMAWTTQVLTNMADLEKHDDAGQFNRSTDFDEVHEFKISWGHRMDVSAAMSNGCRRLLYDRLIGLVWETSNGMLFSAYQAAGEVLLSLGLVSKSEIDVTIVRYQSRRGRAYKGESLLESLGRVDILSSRNRFPCYRFLKPWNNVLNTILVHATACGFTRRISTDRDERWGMDPAVRIALSRAGKLALSLFLRSDPQITLDRNFAEWLNNYRQHQMLLPWLRRGHTAFSVRHASNNRKRRGTHAIVVPGDVKNLGRALF